MEARPSLPSLFNFLRALYIKLAVGYTPKGIKKKEKQNDLSHPKSTA
jgi:hypothetical protein